MSESITVSNLSDSDIMVIEQLTYMDQEMSEFLNKNYGLKINTTVNNGDKGKSIDSILSVFTPDVLEQLENMPADSHGNDGKEWAAMIRYMQENKDISSLVLESTLKDGDGKTLALCFANPDNSSEAVVAFKGTTQYEWGDNVEGLNEVSTERQREALEYIESLPYDNITVTGHSKGGNKAQYVTILSDKVNRCISMDGQGFSQEFIDEYWPEIQEKGGLIKNYSLSTDYVHCLLFPMPGSGQIYVDGSAQHDVVSHHSPASFFTVDKDGNLFVDANGNAQLIIVDSEDPSIQMLHDFTTFILNVAPDSDKEDLVNYIATALDMALGEKADLNDLAEYLLSDPEALSLVLGYLAKYMDTYNMDCDDINALLEMLGFNALNEYFGIQANIFGVKIDVGASNIVNFLLENLTDGKRDYLTEEFLSKINMLMWLLGIDVNWVSVWQDAEETAENIQVPNPSAAKENAQAKTGKIRDFSAERYAALLGAANRLAGMQFDPVSGWSAYSSEDWYDDLHIELFRNALNKYYERVSDVNNTTRDNIVKVFEAVYDIDNAVKFTRLGNAAIRSLILKVLQKEAESIG